MMRGAVLAAAALAVAAPPTAQRQRLDGDAFLARKAVESGAVECSLALVMDQMVPGALKGALDDSP